MIERESRVMVWLLIIGERGSRMAGTDGGSLTVELYKSTTALARDALGWRVRGFSNHSND